MAITPAPSRERYRPAPTSVRPSRKLAWSRSERRRQIRVAAWRQERGLTGAEKSGAPLAGAWRTTLVSARYHPVPPPLITRTSGLVVHVSAHPTGVPTYIYYNSGRMLGRAPLDIRFDRPGRYRLTFWTPDIRGRATRWVTVTGSRAQRLAVVMGPSREIARLR